MTLDRYHGNPLDTREWSEREGRLMADEEARREEQRVSPLAPIHQPIEDDEDDSDDAEV